MDEVYRDRREAGRVLAGRLGEHAGRGDVVVLALPRGGVPVGFEVARVLGAPLDVFLVRKLGVPGHEELAFGAVASGGVMVLNEEVVRALGMDEAAIMRVAEREQRELERRERAYRKAAGALGAAGRTVVLVDDGLATGASMRAAVKALRREGAARIVAAVPVGAVETCAELADEADAVVCARTPAHFQAVGEWYVHFDQTSDDEVRELLAEARRMEPAATVHETRTGGV